MSTDDPLLLIVDDDLTYGRTLMRAFQRRRYRVLLATGYEDVIAILKENTPRYALVDLKLAGRSGLVCVDHLHRHDPTMAVVMLTGFTSIATAVEAIKLGAINYLSKLSDIDVIEKALTCADPNPDLSVAGQPVSIKTMEWEYINQTLIDTDFNISAAARQLSMHRRTLARKLKKCWVK